MKLGPNVLRVTALATLLLAAQVTIARAEVMVMAHALHTATHLRHRGAARHHHSRRTIHATLTAASVHHMRPLAPAPVPSRGERRPAHQRAALPSMTQGQRQHSGFKAGNRDAMVAPALGVPIGAIALNLDRRQNELVTQPAASLKSGRDPPRAGPLHSPPRFLAWRGRILEPAQISSAFDDLLARPANGGRAESCPLASGTPSYSRLHIRRLKSALGRFVTGHPMGCSHACRPEGTAA